MDPVRVAIVVVALLLLAAALAPVCRELGRYARYSPGRTRRMRASDGTLYSVHSSHGDQHGAAEVLAALHNWTVDALEMLRDVYVRSPRGDKFPERRAMVKNILDRYDPDNLAEGSPLNRSGDTSYVTNKGEEFVMCLREKDPRETGSPDKHDFHDMLTLCFVKAHELAHLGVDVRQHPPEFWECFKFLLAETSSMAPGGAWPDYRADPARYCGLDIDYNPLYDPEVRMPV